MNPVWLEDPAGVRPMLASIGEVSLASKLHAYEPKYDGIRAIVAIEPAPQARRATPVRVRFWSRQGNDKTRQFPEIAEALSAVFSGLKQPLLLDGEIVALDAKGHPTSFLHLQNRIHVSEVQAGQRLTSVAFIAFDLLIDGATDVRTMPLVDRRARLDKVMRGRLNATVRVSEQAVGDGRTLQARARADNWEGLVAKRLDSRYLSGKRTPDWRKVKLVRQQTCVIGGWTDPKGSRQHFGALLLGVYGDGGLQHVGQVGTGFPASELEHVWTLLRAASATTSPFVEVPRELARSHWVKPGLACEVKFTEWTLDGKLRHPTYLGLRDDVKMKSVTKEAQPGAERRQDVRRPGRKTRHATTLLDQLDAIQAGSGNGRLALPDGEGLDVTNLGKIFWPGLKLTKGDLFRHYVRVADAILPALAGRPLVMKRYPNGVDAKPFYQHRAADSLPTGVRVAMVSSADGERPHVIGGSLLSLLYTAQLAAISQDPWFSTIDTLDAIDAIAIDLDPPDDLPFRRVLDLALHVRDELETIGAPAFAKTSGSRGVHIYVPMPSGTRYDAGLLYAQIVATMVARKHPKLATVERATAARGRRIYLDYMQNMRGKTLASVYSARANTWAGVSTPLTWKEVEAGVSPRDFTMATIGARLESVGDLWEGLRRAKAADLRAVAKYSS